MEAEIHQFHGNAANVIIDGKAYLGPVIKNLDDRRGSVERKDDCISNFHINEKSMEHDF